MSAIGTPDGALDVELLAAVPGVFAVMVAKAEQGADLEERA
jgi:hypothetical protein